MLAAASMDDLMVSVCSLNVSAASVSWSTESVVQNTRMDFRVPPNSTYVMIVTNSNSLKMSVT